MPQDVDPRAELDGRNIHPVVRMPAAGLSGATIALICAMAAVGLFLILDGNRRHSDEKPSAKVGEPQGILASPPPLVMPLAALEPSRTVAVPNSVPPQPPPVPPMVERPQPSTFAQAYAPSSASPQAVVAPPSRTKTDGGDSPLIIDLAAGDSLGNASVVAGSTGDDQAVRASVIRNRVNLVPQGSMISAVLETPIDSRRPGLVRAIVSRDARGFDGTRVLIPRGSRLIGEVAGDAKTGQRRVLVMWNRLIRPDGVAIRIGSPAADVLGGTGIRGKVNNHFIERFGNAVLQSALTVGVNIASRPRRNSVIVGLPGQIGATGQNLLPNVDPSPTIKVASGAEISVFVARDLDFSGTGLRR